MGFGLPAALGVQNMAFIEEPWFASPQRQLGIQMNVRNCLPRLQYSYRVLVGEILGNRYLGMVKQWQDMIYSGRHS